MKKGIALLMCFTLLLSCSNDRADNIKIEKEYHTNSKLKTLTYHLNKDDIKVLRFMPNGRLDAIYNITNNGNDNFMFIFNSEGHIKQIEFFKNKVLNGKSIWFDSEGNISTESEYINGELIN